MSWKNFSFIMPALTLCLAAAPVGCSPVKMLPASPDMRIANPASEHCISQGGTLVIQKRPDGAEYGICTFPGNRQCEEWAMLRKECPGGGIDMTGYASKASGYCVATGGTYQPSAGKMDGEQGICSFRNGNSCNAAEYFAGRCTREGGKTRASFSDPFAYCSAVETADSPDARYRGEKMPDSIIQAMVRKRLVSGNAPREFRQNAVWRCMNGRVLVCRFGANIPCEEKADLSRVPTPAMENFCRSNPEAEIPATVTGRATVYQWGCGNGKPKVVRQIFRSDSRGFLAEFWQELEK